MARYNYSTFFGKEYVHTNASHWHKVLRTVPSAKTLQKNEQLQKDIFEQEQREKKIYEAYSSLSGTNINSPASFEKFILANDKLKGTNKSLSTVIGSLKGMSYSTTEKKKGGRNTGYAKYDDKDFVSSITKEMGMFFISMKNSLARFEAAYNYLEEGIERAKADGFNADGLAEMQKMQRSYLEAKKTLEDFSKKYGSGAEQVSEKELEGDFGAVKALSKFLKSGAKRTYGLFTEYARYVVLSQIGGKTILTGGKIRSKYDATDRATAGKTDLKHFPEGMEVNYSIKSTSEAQMDTGSHNVSLHSNSPLTGVSKLARSGGLLSQEEIDNMMWFIVNYIKLRNSPFTMGNSEGSGSTRVSGSLEDQLGYNRMVALPMKSIINSALGHSIQDENEVMNVDFLFLKDRVIPKSVIMKGVWEADEQLKAVFKINTMSGIEDMAEFDREKKKRFAKMKDEGVTGDKAPKLYSEDRKFFSDMYNEIMKSKTTISLKGKIDFSKFR